MQLVVKGDEIFASTGGRDHVAGRPFLIFLHGSGQSSVGFNLQSRRFAYDGYNVLTPDFPGHGQSGGVPLATIEGMADWIIALMEAVGVGKAHIVGHSQGCLVALDLASRYQEQVQGAAFIAGAAAIPVNEALVKMAQTNESKAISAMMSWGSGAIGHKFDNTMPGVSHIGMGRQLMAANVRGALAVDLKACNAYQVGLEAAAKITCPTLCVLAEKDKMTPLKAGRQLADALHDNQLVVVPGGGHMLLSENPEAVNRALRSFLA